MRDRDRERLIRPRSLGGRKEAQSPPCPPQDVATPLIDIAAAAAAAAAPLAIPEAGGNRGFGLQTHFPRFFAPVQLQRK